MKKKITLLTAGILCVVCLATGAVAGDIMRDIHAELRTDFTVKVDGEVMEFKNARGETVYPVLYNGTTYLPIHAVGKMMGKTVSWDEQKKTLELNGTTVTNADVFVGGEEKTPEVKEETPKTTEQEKSEPKTETPTQQNQTPAETQTQESAKTNYIGTEAAKSAAIKRAGITADGAHFDRVELDRERGVWVYEVEFKKGGMEYNVDVNALDGSIVEYEAEYDD